MRVVFHRSEHVKSKSSNDLCFPHPTPPIDNLENLISVKGSHLLLCGILKFSGKCSRPLQSSVSWLAAKSTHAEHQSRETSESLTKTKTDFGKVYSVLAQVIAWNDSLSYWLSFQFFFQSDAELHSSRANWGPNSTVDWDGLRQFRPFCVVSTLPQMTKSPVRTWGIF